MDGTILYTSSLPFEAERIMAVALYCSDGRYGDHLDEFLHGHLGLPRYDRLAVPGGAAGLSWRSSTSISHHGLMSDQIEFLVKAHGLRRIVLIAHYGCAYYTDRHAGDAESVLSTQIQDLRDVASLLRNRYVGLQVDCFLARADGEQVNFLAVADR